MKCDVVNLDNGKAGTVDLAEDIFGVAVRADLLQRAVTWQLARRRDDSHEVKTRSDVVGTGAKPYKQKGTGRARQGTLKASQFRSGGRAFGPVARSFATGLPKKVRKLALKTALSAKQADGKLVVLETAAVDEPKTAALAKRIAALGWGSTLVIDGPEVDGNFKRAIANLPGLDVLPSQGANVYDILRRDTLVVTKAGVAALEARLK